MKAFITVLASLCFLHLSFAQIIHESSSSFSSSSSSTTTTTEAKAVKTSISPVSSSSVHNQTVKLKNEAVMAYNDGISQFNMGNYAAAIPLFKQAVNKSADFSKALEMLAYCYNKTNDVKQSIATYKQLLTYQPGNEKTWYNLGLLYLSEGEKTEALAAFKKANALKPSFKKAQQKLASLQNDGSVKEASRVNEYDAVGYYNNKYRQALSSDTDETPDAESWYVRGLAYKGTDKAEAIKAFKNAILLDDKHVEAHNQLGVLSYNNKNYRGAYKAFATSLKLKEDKQISYYAGQAAFYAKNFATAISLLEKTVSEQPDNNEAACYLAKSYLGNKDEKKYGKYYQKEALRSACKLESYKKVHKSSWSSSSTSVEVESGWRNRRAVEVFSTDDKAPSPGTKTMTEKELKRWKKNKKKKGGA